MTAYKKTMGMADTAVATPYNPDSEKQIAGFTAPTTQAFGDVLTNQGIAQPYMSNAALLGGQGADTISGDDIAGYMNPYTQQVVDATQRDFDVQNRRQISGVTGNARINGSLGGDREAVAQALTAEAQSRTQAPIIANLRSQGYSTALGAAQGDKQRQLAGSQLFSNLGTTAQQAAAFDVGQLYQSGGMQQALTQAEMDAASANAAARSSYPFQLAQWYAGIVNPTGANMGSTTTGSSTTQGPTPNTWSQLAGGLIAAAPYAAKAAPAMMAMFADGGRVPDGISMGYIPNIPIASGGGLRPAPLMQAPAFQPAGDAGAGFADTAKMTEAGMKGIGEIGTALRTTQGPGGWSTTVNPESAAGWGSYLGKSLGFADGGAVPEMGAAPMGMAPAASPLAMHMRDILEAAQAMRSEMPVTIPHKAGGGGLSPNALALHMGLPADAARIYDGPVVETPAIAMPTAAPSVPAPPVLALPEGSGSASMGFNQAYEPPMLIPEGDRAMGVPVIPGSSDAAVSGWSTTVEPTARTYALPSAGISRPAPAAEKPAGSKSFLEWLASDDAANMLVPVGLGIMSQGAGGSGSFGLNFGRGASEGLKVYREGESSRKEGLRKQQQIDMEARRLQLDADRAAMEQLQVPGKMANQAAQTALAESQAELGKYVNVKPGDMLWDAKTKQFVTVPGGSGEDAQRQLFLKAYAGKAPEYLDKASQEFATAKTTEKVISDLQALADKADTGWGAEYIQTARRVAERFGLSYDPEKMAATDMFRNLTQQFVLQEAQKLKPLSNADVTFVERGLATIQQSPETLKVMLPALKREQQRVARAKQLEMQFLENGRPPPKAAIEEMVDKELPSELRRLFNAETGAFKTPATAPSAAADSTAKPRDQLLALPDGRHTIGGVLYEKKGTVLTPVPEGISKPSAGASAAAPATSASAAPKVKMGTAENPYPERPSAFSKQVGDYYRHNGKIYRADYWKDTEIGPAN
jgi:hypothetical protein